jgi:fructokinase
MQPKFPVCAEDRIDRRALMENSQSHQYTIIGLGELLWDLLPDGKQLGGAPANFAYMAAMLGDRSFIASRIGADPLGREAVERLKTLGLSTDYIQIDAERPTGSARVEVDESGQPNFVINKNAAWDYLEFEPRWFELARRADAVCFGTLAQRSAGSRATITAFLRTMRDDALRIFDVNLRQSFFSADVLCDSLRLANIVKLNDQELPCVMEILSLKKGDDKDNARRLIAAYDLKMVSVTRGARGSLLVSGSETAEHEGIKVEIADAVGAGDAFTAALTHHYLRGAALQAINQASACLGAWVASQIGATPTMEPEVLKRIIGAANAV